MCYCITLQFFINCPRFPMERFQSLFFLSRRSDFAGHFCPVLEMWCEILNTNHICSFHFDVLTVNSCGANRNFVGHFRVLEILGSVLRFREASGSCLTILPFIEISWFGSLVNQIAIICNSSANRLTTKTLQMSQRYLVRYMFKKKAFIQCSGPQELCIILLVVVVYSCISTEPMCRISAIRK